MLFGKKYDDNDILAVTTGDIVPVETINDPVFAKEMMGKTLALQPLNEKMKIVSPVNGKIEVLYPTGHAFAVKMKNGISILVHIGIDTATLKGKGFKILANQGDTVKAGQTILKADFKYLKDAGFDVSTMMIVAENPNNIELTFKKDQKINAAESVLA